MEFGQRISLRCDVEEGAGVGIWRPDRRADCRGDPPPFALRPAASSSRARHGLTCTPTPCSNTAALQSAPKQCLVSKRCPRPPIAAPNRIAMQLRRSTTRNTKSRTRFSWLVAPSSSGRWRWTGRALRQRQPLHDSPHETVGNPSLFLLLLHVRLIHAREELPP